MKAKEIAIFIWIFLIPLLLIAQGSSQLLMPGKVMKAHERFEKACDTCHESGGINESLCISCHREINLTMHGKNCLACHSEHRGRAYSGLKLSIENFNHKITGYSLKNHENLTCDDCHDKGYSFSEDKCIACHKKTMDIEKHISYFSKACLSCHRNGKVELGNFDHSKVGYYIDKHHRRLACNDCHAHGFNRSEITCDSLFCHNYFKIEKEHAEHGIDYKSENCFSCHKGKKKKHDEDD